MIDICVNNSTIHLSEDDISSTYTYEYRLEYSRRTILEINTTWGTLHLHDEDIVKYKDIIEKAMINKANKENRT